MFGTSELRHISPAVCFYLIDRYSNACFASLNFIFSIISPVDKSHLTLCCSTLKYCAENFKRLLQLLWNMNFRGVQNRCTVRREVRVTVCILSLNNHSWWWGKARCHLLRGSGCGISCLFCPLSGKVCVLEILTLLGCTDDGGKISLEKNLACFKLESRQKNDCEFFFFYLNNTSGSCQVQISYVGMQHWPAWLDSPSARYCFCCSSFLSLTMTYPSRVCSASSFSLQQQIQ